MIPPAEKIVADHLRDNEGVAAMVGRRVVTKPPSETGEPWVMVTQLAARQSDVADHLIAFYLQFDCYVGPPTKTSGGSPEANLLGRTVREALQSLNGEQTGGVVSGVQIEEDRRLPDDTFEPARQRQILGARIWMHA